ncbi:ABC transporter permease [Rhodocaloribacter litoris]|uniref:ABC transporter permease n=1 Tax=Rhodocaloribacter litoris TaxID=2558931 RepID=UPI001421B1EA|nr:ABC transporter permease [Rhodocaloribacter litoris]QXD14782.1 ABC transporter permease [Rhodocaloribacter litoris]GIV59132.1 MAG: ABC transporter permease [Rhodothermaceae bacterium]
MKPAWILMKRELNAAFDSPSAYVVLIAFLLIVGWFFGNGLFLQNVASLRTVFDLAPIIFMFFVPAVTMATFAEERRAGTLELLLTMPVRDWQVITGKLLAVTVLLWSAIGLTGLYALTIAVLGDPDFGATAGGYLGLMLLAVTYGAIGLLASSLTRNQIVAFILGFAIIFALFMMDKVTDFVPGALAGLLEYLSIDYHYRNLLRGVIDSRDVLYYLSVTFFACLLTAYHLARRPE